MLQDRCDYFILAYESPSFSAAAAKVPMSPQGFTKAIHNMERELGVPLFATEEDGTRRATPYAHEFYEYSKRVRAERNLLSNAFERIASSGYVELRIACSLGIPGFLGYDFLEDFSKKHADVSISLDEMPDTLCESALRDGLYDMALMVTSDGDEFVSHPLYSSPVWYWMRSDDPLSRQGSVGVEDLAGRLIAIPGDDFKCYQALVDQFARNGLEAPRIVKYSEIFWIYEFVLHGKGVGFTLPHLARLEVFKGSGDVVAVPLRDSSWGFGASHLEAHAPSAVEEELVQYLRDRVASLRRGSSKAPSQRTRES